MCWQKLYLRSSGKAPFISYLFRVKFRNSLFQRTPHRGCLQKISRGIKTFFFFNSLFTYWFSGHGHNENLQACVMITQKQILDQSKYMPPGYTVRKDHIKKIILQVLLERRWSPKVPSKRYQNEHIFLSLKNTSKEARRNCIYKVHQNNVNFSSIKITSKIVLRNGFDLNPIKIMTKNVRWNDTVFLSIKTMLKKIRQNDVDLLLIEITSKKMRWNDSEIHQYFVFVVST